MLQYLKGNFFFQLQDPTSLASFGCGAAELERWACQRLKRSEEYSEVGSWYTIQRSETGPSLFICTYDNCGKPYRDKRDTIDHIYSLHLGKNGRHVCPLCKKTFTWIKKLTSHLKMCPLNAMSGQASTDLTLSHTQKWMDILYTMPTGQCLTLVHNKVCLVLFCVLLPGSYFGYVSAELCVDGEHCQFIYL